MAPSVLTSWILTYGTVIFDVLDPDIQHRQFWHLGSWHTASSVLTSWILTYSTVSSDILDPDIWHCQFWHLGSWYTALCVLTSWILTYSTVSSDILDPDIQHHQFWHIGSWHTALSVLTYWILTYSTVSSDILDPDIRHCQFWHLGSWHMAPMFRNTKILNISTVKTLNVASKTNTTQKCHWSIPLFKPQHQHMITHSALLSHQNLQQQHISITFSDQTVALRWDKNFLLLTMERTFWMILISQLTEVSTHMSVMTSRRFNLGEPQILQCTFYGLPEKES